jgi:hypothetical protein
MLAAQAQQNWDQGTQTHPAQVDSCPRREDASMYINKRHAPGKTRYCIGDFLLNTCLAFLTFPLCEKDFDIPGQNLIQSGFDIWGFRQCLLFCAFCLAKLRCSGYDQ